MKISLKVYLTFLIIGALTLFAAGKTQAEEHATDGEIIGLMMAVDNNEIDAAHQAEDKNIDPDVKIYVKMLDIDHSADLSQWQVLESKSGIQVPTTAGAVLRAKGTKGVALRAVLNGHDFEKAFINDMVEGHLDVLNLIDNELMKDVQNPDVKSQLAATRTHVAMHLEKAKELQNKI